jgi:hypothetical protein
MHLEIFRIEGMSRYRLKSCSAFSIPDQEQRGLLLQRTAAAKDGCANSGLARCPIPKMHFEMEPDTFILLVLFSCRRGVKHLGCPYQPVGQSGHFPCNHIGTVQQDGIVS